MKTKTERIAELLVIISNKSGRIKKLKLECGQQSTQICVLNLRIKELEEAINYATDGIDALSGNWDEHTKKDVLAIKQTLEVQT